VKIRIRQKDDDSSGDPDPIRIRSVADPDAMPLRPLDPGSGIWDPGWVKSQDPDPG
jgi:hypothetical protein